MPRFRQLSVVLDQRLRAFIALAAITLCLSIHFASSASAAEPGVLSTPLSLEGDFIFIEVTVGNSQPLEFIFDTGAGTTVINQSASEALGLTRSRRVQTSGAAGSFDVDVIRDVQLSVAGLDLGKFKVQSSDLSHLERAIGRKIDGIIGFHLLKRQVVALDYDAMVLRIYPSSYRYVERGARIPLQRKKLARARTTITLPDGEGITAKFVLDTGAGIAAGFSAPYIRKHQLIDRLQAAHRSRPRGYSGARPTVRHARLPKLLLSDFVFTDVPVSLYDVRAGFFAERGQAGVIGNALLKRFNIVFDYPRRQSWWERNERFRDSPFTVNCSGMSLALDTDLDRVLIDEVQDNSPAAVAGLQSGDELIALQGLKARDTALHELESWLKRDGEVARLRYRRAGVEHAVSIQLAAPY